MLALEQVQSSPHDAGLEIRHKGIMQLFPDIPQHWQNHASHRDFCYQAYAQLFGENIEAEYLLFWQKYIPGLNGKVKNKFSCVHI